MNYDSTTRVLTIDNYYDIVKFARKQDWEFNCNHPKKIIIDVYDVLDPISPKDVDNLMDKKVYTQVECFEVTHPMNRSLKTIDGILYTKDGKTLILCPPQKIGRVEIAEGTETIYEGAFKNCRINGVKFPDSMRRIESSAFCECRNLKVVEMNNDLEYILDAAFYSCHKLKKVKFAKKLKKIAYGAFYSTNLKKITLPEGLTGIGPNAFARCHLKDVYLPDSIVSIGNGAFSWTDNIYASRYHVNILYGITTNYAVECNVLDTMTNGRYAMHATLHIEGLTPIVVPRCVDNDVFCMSINANDMDMLNNDIKKYIETGKNKYLYRLYMYGHNDRCKEDTAIAIVMRYKNATSAKRYLTRMAEDIAKRAVEKNEEKFVQMLNAVEWSDTALRRMLPAMEESELQIAKAYILEKIRTKETFDV